MTNKNKSRICYECRQKGLTGDALEVTLSFFCDLSGCKVSHKIPEEVFRGVYAKLE
jgi:hypothetical protein